jgi:hypothetical protein
MKLHEIQTKLEEVTGVSVIMDDKGFKVLVLGDQPELVKPTAEKLKAAGIPFRQKPKGKKFAGATYIVALRNIGTTFNADWVYA